MRYVHLTQQKQPLRVHNLTRFLALLVRYDSTDMCQSYRGWASCAYAWNVVADSFYPKRQIFRFLWIRFDLIRLYNSQ